MLRAMSYLCTMLAGAALMVVPAQIMAGDFGGPITNDTTSAMMTWGALMAPPIAYIAIAFILGVFALVTGLAANQRTTRG